MERASQHLLMVAVRPCGCRDLWFSSGRYLCLAATGLGREAQCCLRWEARCCLRWEAQCCLRCWAVLVTVLVRDGGLTRWTMRPCP